MNTYNFCQVAPVGNLSIFEVYLYYDGPKLFACRNVSEQVFITVWTEDGATHDSWLLVPVSSTRFRMLRSGTIELRIIFQNLEDGYLFRIQTDKRTGAADAVPVLPEMLLQDELPQAGQFLEAPSEEVALTPPILSNDETAKSTWRPAMDLRLIMPSRYGQAAPLRTLSELFWPLQGTLDALVYGSAVNLSAKGRLPAKMLGHTELAFQASYPGSFGMRLTATEQADLFGNSPIEVALDRLVELIECGAEKDRLQAKLRGIPKRAATSYGNFLQQLLGQETGIEIAWSSPIGNRGRYARMAVSEIRSAVLVVNEVVLQIPEEILVTGPLIGLNVRLKTFELHDRETGRPYRGRISDEALGVDRATISDSYVARIQRTVEVNAVTGDETIHWHLLGLVDSRDLEEQVVDPAAR